MRENRGQLVLLRHGQSTANADGQFTGILDVPLSERGTREAQTAALLLRDGAFTPEAVFTSELIRARQTADILATHTPHDFPSVRPDWRLNERNYGALTGRSKSAVLAEFGAERFLVWRRSVDTVPPAMTDTLYNDLAATSLYQSLPAAALTRGESLRDVIRRVDAFYLELVEPVLHRGGRVWIVAHGNSLRALCGVLDDLSDDALQSLNIPTGQPLVYRFREDLRPACPGGEYLDATTALAAAIALEHEGGT